MSPLWKRVIPFAAFIIVASVLFVTMQNESSSRMATTEISFSEFLKQVDDGKIHDVTIVGNVVSGHFMSNNRMFNVHVANYPNLITRLEAKNVQINVKPMGENDIYTAIFINLLPVLFFVAVWIYLSRRMNGGAGRGPMGFGKSKAKLMDAEESNITFDDVAGIDEAKEDVTEIVEFLRDPHKFERLGGRIPKGVLLVGPPGTGKTLLAKAIAGEAEVPFFSISGSDFVEIFVGVGASRVRDLFEQAKKNAPCIVFVDEIDAVGRHRGGGFGGNDEREQTLNQLLVEMDGFNDNEGIIIIAATNRSDVLDKALLRPGRFDRQIQVPNPDFIGRESILKVHAKKVPLGPDVDLKTIARGTPGFSGADLMNLVNESALLAARRSKRIITAQEFEDARDKILMGAERRTLLMTEEEKKMTAYHEAGHALVSLKMPGSEPIHKATIIPRGGALGMVQSLPERDKVSQSYEEMISMLAMAMGGRVAEELVFGANKVTSGAAGDIQQSTRLARAMVTQLGFSRKLGPIAFDGPQQESMGFPMGQPKNISENTQRMIDAEVARFVNEGYDKARQILTKNRGQLNTLAEALIEYETLSGQEIKDLLNGKKPVR